MSTNVTRRSRRSAAVPTAKALVSIVPAALHQQTQHGPNHNMPSPGRQTSGMARPPARAGLGWVDRVGHPVVLPPGLPHGAPGGRATRVLSG
ncbi:MAG: hypothetical protein ACRDR6_28140, partial [Pseudonocardiaceae bacterium]